MLSDERRLQETNGLQTDLITPPPPRIGVIGCGYWGPQLIRNLSEIRGASLAGVADQRPARRQYVLESYPNVKVFEDYHDLLSSDIEAVVIATPIKTHHFIARDALLAGKHVLVEKPLAASTAEALELIRIAMTTGRVLMVGHTFIYNPAVQALRDIVRSGELGSIYYVDAARLSLGLFQPDISVLWDLAPHDISILIYLLGSAPISVSAQGMTCIRPNIYDVASLKLQFDGGVVGHVRVSWLDPNKVRRMTVVGDRKMAVYDDVSLTEKIRIYDKGIESPPAETFGEFQLAYRHGEITIPNIQWQEPLRLECEHFAEAIRGDVIARTDGFQGLQVVAALEAAERSLASNGLTVPIDIPDELADCPISVKSVEPVYPGLGMASGYVATARALGDAATRGDAHS